VLSSPACADGGEPLAPVSLTSGLVFADFSLTIILALRASFMVAPVRWRLATSTSSGPHTSLKPGQDGKDLIGGVMANSQYNHFVRLQATVS
jgi:hypothetical protein